LIAIELTMKINHLMVEFHGNDSFVILRHSDFELVRTALRRSRVVILAGPRQCGKTTLARQFVPPNSRNYFDLEDPASLARLSEPDLALRRLRMLVCIDEIQRRPELFPLLRVLADRKPLPARFLILGILYPDERSYSLGRNVDVLPLASFVKAK